MKDQLMLISGTASTSIAKDISKMLKVELNPTELKKFNDGELYTKIGRSVRGTNCFIIQSTSPPVNDNLMQLLLMIDALKRGSAKEITAVIPYFGYARQDRKATPREPISAKVVADMISKVGTHRVVTFDLHVDQIQGFFDIPVDNLEAQPLMAQYLLEKGIKDMVVVAPDVGGTKRARRLAESLNTKLAIVDKRRPEHGVSEIMHIIGKVKDKNCILVDDIIDTAGTIVGAAKALKEKGAKDIYICATHGLLNGDAIERLQDKSIKEVILTDTIDIPKEKRIKKMKIISLANLLSESIKRIHQGNPMGVIFDNLYEDIKTRRSKTE